MKNFFQFQTITVAVAAGLIIETANANLTFSSVAGEGKIESIVLRKRGRQRGVHLIAFDSLMGYLRQLGAEQNPKRRR